MHLKKKNFFFLFYYKYPCIHHGEPLSLRHYWIVFISYIKKLTFPEKKSPWIKVLIIAGPCMWIVAGKQIVWIVELCIQQSWRGWRMIITAVYTAVQGTRSPSMPIIQYLGGWSHTPWVSTHSDGPGWTFPATFCFALGMSASRLPLSTNIQINGGVMNLGGFLLPTMWNIICITGTCKSWHALLWVSIQKPERGHPHGSSLAHR